MIEIKLKNGKKIKMSDETARELHQKLCDIYFYPVYPYTPMPYIPCDPWYHPEYTVTCSDHT
jgi:hypothetical protein